MGLDILGALSMVSYTARTLNSRYWLLGYAHPTISISTVSVPDGLRLSVGLGALMISAIV